MPKFYMELRVSMQIPPIYDMNNSNYNENCEYSKDYENGGLNWQTVS